MRVAIPRAGSNVTGRPTISNSHSSSIPKARDRSRLIWAAASVGIAGAELEQAASAEVIAEPAQICLDALQRLVALGGQQRHRLIEIAPLADHLDHAAGDRVETVVPTRIEVERHRLLRERPKDDVVRDADPPAGLHRSGVALFFGGCQARYPLSSVLDDRAASGAYLDRSVQDDDRYRQ